MPIRRLGLVSKAALINRVVGKIRNDAAFWVISHAVNEIREVVLKFHNVFGVLNLLLFIRQAPQPSDFGGV